MTDRVPEVGQDIEAYCTSCKMDLNHVVVAKLENVVKKVRCQTCNKEHLFRPPKGKGKGRAARARRKASGTKRGASPAPLDLDLDPDLVKPYRVSDAYETNDYVDHPKFGRGRVAACVGRRKISVEFEDGTRLLICNRA